MPGQLATAATVGTNTDFLPLQGTDYVEFYVGNAKQAAHFTKQLVSSHRVMRDPRLNKGPRQLCHPSGETDFCLYHTAAGR